MVVAGSGCVDVDSGMVVGGGSVVGVDVEVCGNSLTWAQVVVPWAWVVLPSSSRLVALAWA